MKLLIVDSDVRQMLQLVDAFKALRRGRTSSHQPQVFDSVDTAHSPKEADQKVADSSYDFVLLSTAHPQAEWAALASSLSRQKVPCAMCVEDPDFTAEIPDDVPVWQQEKGTLRMDLVSRILKKWKGLPDMTPKATGFRRLLQSFC
jgi:hypothetical protein